MRPQVHELKQGAAEEDRGEGGVRPSSIQDRVLGRTEGVAAQRPETDRGAAVAGPRPADTGGGIHQKQIAVAAEGQVKAIERAVHRDRARARRGVPALANNSFLMSNGMLQERSVGSFENMRFRPGVRESLECSELLRLLLLSDCLWRFTRSVRIFFLLASERRNYLSWAVGCIASLSANLWLICSSWVASSLPRRISSSVSFSIYRQTFRKASNSSLVLIWSFSSTTSGLSNCRT